MLSIDLKSLPRSSLTVVAAIFFIFALSSLLPLSWVEGVPLCLIKFFTGFDCPGCGLTRAFVCFFHGKVIQSLRFNPLGVPLIFVFFSYFLRHAYRLMKGQYPQWTSESGQKIIAFLLVFLLFSHWIWKIFSQKLILTV